MSNTTTNLTGKISFDYKTEILSTGQLTSVSLYVKSPNNDVYEFYDCVTSILSNSAQAIEEALEKGSKKWGIQLIKQAKKVA